MAKRFVALIQFVLASALMAACAGRAAPEVTVGITATEFDFSPAAIELTAGTRVRLVLANSGTLEHDISIVEFPMDDVAGGQGHGAGGHDTDSTGEEPDLHLAAAAGDRAELQFTPTQPGTYGFFCAVPGHKDAGMTGTLVVAPAQTAP